MYALVWKDSRNGERNAQIPQGRALTMGRAESCDVTLDDDAASRQHARLRIVDGQVEIEDLGSRNGTWLADKRISTAKWKPGRVVRIGGTEIALRAEDLSTQDTVVTSKGGAGVPAVAASRAGNFVTRHWRGGYSLGRSILVNTFLLSLLLAIVVANLTEHVAADSSPRARLLFVTASFLLGLAVLVWQFVGNWRSLRGAKARGAGRASRWAAGTFIALLALAVPFTVVEYGAARSALRDIETGRAAGGDMAYTLARDGNILIFSGVVAWPLVRDFEETLDKHADVNVVVLNSPGGDTTAGRRINDLIRARPITTAVFEGCASACTLIYAGGERRLLGPNGQLGFHATSVILTDAMMTRIMNSLTFRHDTLNADYYREAGFDEAFIARAVATPSTDLWVPSHDVLLQAGVVHEILQQQ